MSNLRLYPYSLASESAKDLAKYLNCLRVHPAGNYFPRMGQLVIGWGNSQTPAWAQRASLRGVRILNKPAAVKIAANKLHALTELRRVGVTVPDFTTDRYTAQAWLDHGGIVFERHTLTGNSGDGIQIVSMDQDPDDPSTIRNYLSSAPLYTKYVPKTTEFRVHVFKGEVIDYIEKKKMAADRRPDNFNRYVSSVNLGWVFARKDILDSTEVRQCAIRAVASLGLDFGAVDIAYANGTPYVLEVNTAPGLHGTTLVNYVNAFRRYMGAPLLSENQINEIMSQAGDSNSTTTAAISALDSEFEDEDSTTIAISQPPTDRIFSPVPVADEVLLRLDKQTALKLKHLLSQIV